MNAARHITETVRTRTSGFGFRISFDLRPSGFGFLVVVFLRFKRLYRTLYPPQDAIKETDAVHAQKELNFGSRGASDQGYTKWLKDRRLAVEEAARRMNLPLGHEVEVWLTGGIRLRGRLRLQEGLLFIDEDRVRHLGLMVENVAFVYREIESCVRLD